MNILFDISVLGIKYAVPHQRTGIFRYVENMAIGLDAVKTHELAFCASEGNYKSCQEYLSLSKQLNGRVVSQPSSILASIYNTVEPIRLNIGCLPPYQWKRPLRKIYNLGKNLIPIAFHMDLRQADIFHSPSHAFPEQIKFNKKIKKIITIHDLIPLKYPEYCYSSSPGYMRAILNSMTEDTFVACVSESTRNDLLSFMPALAPEKVSVTYLAADDHFYPCSDVGRINIIRSKYNIPSGDNYFLALSTLQPRKNYKRIIRSFVDLLKTQHLKDVYLLLVGPHGWDYQEIYDEIRDADDLSKYIIITGYVPDEDLAPLYSGALAFLYPSLYEGFGLPPLEAMQCGTPVITSNNSSLPEVVENAAIMIDPKDGEALSQAMLDIYTNADLRASLSAASIMRARYFNWTTTIQQTLNVYNNAIISS